MTSSRLKRFLGRGATSRALGALLSPRFTPALASLVLLGSAAIAAWTLVRAIRLEPLPARPRAHAVARIASRAADHPDSAAARAMLAAAVEHDPFQPDRHRPAERFRLPGEALPGPAVEAARAAAPEAPLRLIGTVVLSNGESTAMCQYARESPKLLHVGGRIGDLTLTRVEQGRAVFLSADGAKIEIHVPKAGS